MDRARGLDSGWAWEQDGSGGGRMKVENIGRDNWNHGYLWDEPETYCNGNLMKSASNGGECESDNPQLTQIGYSEVLITKWENS